MINRRKNADRRARKAIINEAVRKSRAPRTPTPGATAPTGVTDTLPPNTQPDENGNTIFAALTEIDFTQSEFARTI